MISLISKIVSFYNLLYSKFKLRNMRYKGSSIYITPKIRFKNKQYISIGDNCFLGKGCRIEAWDKYNDKNYLPEIIIGNDVKIYASCHIGAINKIVIGDQCLFGSNVMIIDHSHGRSILSEAEIHPSKRDLYSKGEIVIGPLTWIGENAVILPGVHIGRSVIIGANAVVTKNIPDYSVAVGNPAKVVKKIV